MLIIEDLSHYFYFFRDVSRHTLLSRFFIPDTAVSGFVPLNLYRRNKKDNTFICLNTTEQPNKLKKTLPQWSSRHTTNTKLNLFPKEDLVISVLVATCPDIKSSYRRMPDGCWKLGLLINNKVVLNHTLDARYNITDFIFYPATIRYLVLAITLL